MGHLWFSPTLSGFILKQSWRIFKASSNFFRASAAHWDFFFNILERSNNFPQAPQALTPDKLQKKKSLTDQYFYAFPILVLYSLDFLLLRKLINSSAYLRFFP